PEKLEQRAKPRRRKHNSPQDSNPSPQHHTAPSSVGSGNTNMQQHSYMPSPMSSTTASTAPIVSVAPPGQHPASSLMGSVAAGAPNTLGLSPSPAMLAARSTSLNYTNFTPNLDIPSVPNVMPHSAGGCTESAYGISPSTHVMSARDRSHHLNVSRAQQQQQQSFHPLDHSTSRPDLIRSTSHHVNRHLARMIPCQRTMGRTLCRHPRCRRSLRQINRRNRKRMHNHGLLNSGSDGSRCSEVDARMLTCLRDCVQRIREPFTPEEQLETGVAVTLEQEYNRMDACIRRIIRVVKLLPYFSDIGKPAQLSLLRTNIYGLIVLYSSFFFERGIRKLRYPVLQSDGQLTTVTVSMLDEVVTPSANGGLPVVAEDDGLRKSTVHSSAPSNCSLSPCRAEHKYTSGLREEFELYKANTLAAFDHLDQLIGPDDVVRVSVLAIKLFTDESLPDSLRSSVCAARQAYLLFLWTYLRSRAGPKRLRSTTELYARLLIAFVDLRTLEIRMTEFAKLLSLDGLSPLMREVCSQRAALAPVRG
ncbi:Nuclear receptor nhr-48, partial [Fasciola gigantica]